MLATAFANVFNPLCLALIWAGTMIGIIFGSIPGLSATMAVVLFLPLTFSMEPTAGLALLVGLYMGGISGGLISAILLKIPGTPSSISTVFDGGPMADKGEAGRALGVGILSSAIGSLLGIFALMFISPALAKVCLLFGATEYFAVSVFSLTIIASLSGKDMLKGLLSGLFGIAIAMVGMAPIDATTRFTFGNYQLMSGFDITVLLIGVFAVTDIIAAGFGRRDLSKGAEKKKYHLRGYGMSVKELVTKIPNFLISSAIGIGIGILPGIGGSTGGLLAYTAEKNRSKHPEKFGTGIVDGVIASETANNAVIGGSLVPLLCMGIPGNTVAAVFLGGLLVQGISPGPLIFEKSGQYVYGIYLALIVSTIFMFVFERLGLPVFAKLLDIPKHILLPIIMVMCCVGAFSSDNRVFDVKCVLIFGLIGLFFKAFKLPGTPLIIGFILGPMFEENLRRALQASHGNWSIFLTRPISCVFLIIAVVFCAITVRKNLKEKKMAETKGVSFDTAEEDG
ncbi:tripartite tricarboxylate transporter permease [Oscillibacter sp.]|uniref:tripartite tricarboxylate transporter permease n=1 Tax=Oscillibacter sp. TaxID=1945593 RepID=UPI0028986F29|nr:tripartite tricarboxylate transporter permease [Oscillibacter sp.]